MKSGYIIVREHRVVGPQYWVFETLEDAEKVFDEIAAYWRKEYDDRGLDEETYGDQIRALRAEDAFDIELSPIKIHEPGETSS